MGLDINVGDSVEYRERYDGSVMPDPIAVVKQITYLKGIGDLDVMYTLEFDDGRIVKAIRSEFKEIING